MSSKGYPFKVLAPKDIAAVLNMIGMHPQVTPEAIDKPTPEIACSFFQHLAEFAYDMDAQQVKAQMPEVVQRCGQQHPEVLDESMDVLTVFRLTRQLVLINVVDDFGLKDLWEPNAKRFRILLSAIINFCRYKEGRVTLIASLKEQQQVFEQQRLEHVQAASQKEQELHAAQERNSQELRPMREAERDLQKCHAEVEKLQGQTQCANRVAEEAASTLTALKKHLEAQEEEKQKLQEQIDVLQGQIAESPEGIEQEIGDLQEGLRRERNRIEERSHEKRAATLHNQALGRLQDGLEASLQELQQLREAADTAMAAQERGAAASDELERLQQFLEARRTDEADLEQRVRHIALEHERTKQAHEERLQELEERRQRALEKHHELQVRKAEEQRERHQLHTQRLELEAEVAGARRAHEVQAIELRERQQATHDQAQAYIRNIDNLLQHHLSVVEGGSCRAITSELSRGLMQAPSEGQGNGPQISRSPSPV